MEALRAPEGGSGMDRLIFAVTLVGSPYLGVLERESADLGSPEFRVRETTQAWLEARREGALPCLTWALTSNDCEVRHRAKKALKEILKAPRYSEYTVGRAGTVIGDQRLVAWYVYEARRRLDVGSQYQGSYYVMREAGSLLLTDMLRCGAERERVEKVAEELAKDDIYNRFRYLPVIEASDTPRDPLLILRKLEDSFAAEAKDRKRRSREGETDGVQRDDYGDQEEGGLGRR